MIKPKKDPWDVCAKCNAIFDTRANPDEKHGCNGPVLSEAIATKIEYIPAGGMSKGEYFAFHQDFCQRMMDITAAKNADYTGNSADPFANFTLVETFGALTTEQGFFARMTDKFARISSFIQNGELQVKNESVGDTLLDLANYCALLAGYLKSKEAK